MARIRWKGPGRAGAAVFHVVIAAASAGLASCSEASPDGEMLETDLSGLWRDEGGGPRRMLLEHFEDTNMSPAAGSATYALKCLAGCWWRGGFCSTTPTLEPTRRLRIKCDLDVGSGKRGYLTPAGHLEWEVPMADVEEVWHRATPYAGRLKAGRKVQRTHAVFTSPVQWPPSLGSGGAAPGAELTTYFALTAKNDSREPYTAEPWLLQQHLQCACREAPCPNAFSSAFVSPLQCPTPREAEKLEAALFRHTLTWTAAPLSLQAEAMSPMLFRAALRIAQQLDKRFYGGQHSRTWLAQGVPQLSRAVLTLLRESGITNLVVGAQGPLPGPQLPRLYSWLDPSSGAEALVLFHPFSAGQSSSPDCVEAPQGVALCSITGGAAAASTRAPKDERKDVLAQIQTAYPGAQVNESTFDAFMSEMQAHAKQLPVIDLEVGDPSIFSMAGDPLHAAQSRAVQRVWGACLNSGDRRCSLDDKAIANMTAFLLKALESVAAPPPTDSSPVSGFEEGQNGTLQDLVSAGVFCSLGTRWAERRFFNELAVRALEESGHHLAADVRREVQLVSGLSEAPPALELMGYSKVPPDEAVALADGQVLLTFGTDGSIQRFRHRSKEWASEAAPLGAFAYRTFTRAWQGQESVEGVAAAEALVENRTWRPKLDELWLDAQGRSVVALLSMPAESHEVFGAPRELLLNVTIPRLGTSGGENGKAPRQGLDVDIELQWRGKRPTLVGEAATFAFRPAPALVAPRLIAPRGPRGSSPGAFRAPWRLRRPIRSSAWRLEKLSSLVDPEGVVGGGSFSAHGVWGGAMANTKDGAFHVESFDTATISPVLAGVPFGNPLPVQRRTPGQPEEDNETVVPKAQPVKPGKVLGVAANLHNNLGRSGSTPLYYPYFDPRFCESPTTCAESGARFRFRLNLGRPKRSDWRLPIPSAARQSQRSVWEETAIAVVIVGGGLGIFLGLRALHTDANREFLIERLEHEVRADLEMLPRREVFFLNGLDGPGGHYADVR